MSGKQKRFLNVVKDLRVLAAMIVVTSAFTSYTVLAHQGREVIQSPRGAAEEATERVAVSAREGGDSERQSQGSSKAAHRGGEQRKEGSSPASTSSAEVKPAVQIEGGPPIGAVASQAASLSLASQFQANGCRWIGSTTLRYDDREAVWSNYQELAYGARGECVKSLQRKLNTYCSNKLDVDGIFGPRTESAIRAYQQHMRARGGITIDGATTIYVDGIVGPQTYALMQHFSASPALPC